MSEKQIRFVHLSKTLVIQSSNTLSSEILVNGISNLITLAYNLRKKCISFLNLLLKIFYLYLFQSMNFYSFTSTSNSQTYDILHYYYKNLMLNFCFFFF